MAEIVTIDGSDATYKLRSPVWVAVWTLVTCGIYGIVWTYKVARELRDYGRARGYDLGQSPGMTLLAVTLGALIIVPALVAWYRLAKRVQGAQRIAGPEPVNGWIALLLYLVFFPAFPAYLQSGLNSVWRWETGRAESAVPYPPTLPAS
jgi:hypothetical protein